MNLSALLQSRLSLITPRLVKRKPRFLIRAFSRLISQKVLNRDGIRAVLFHSHYKCNLNCEHCYEKNFLRTDEEPLSLDEKQRIIAECLELGVLSFDFVGGETSLDPTFPELVKACRPEKTYLTLATNGYNIAEDKIKYFLDIGIDKLNISIDSWYSEVHDAFRDKKGCHASVFRTIELCRKTGMGANFCMVVYRDYTKTEDFKKIVEYVINNKIRLGFIPAVPLGKWETSHDKLITPEDSDAMLKLHKKYPLLFTSDSYANRNCGCPAFSELLTITAYGDVLPCNFIHISFGNLRRESLKSILKKSCKIKYFDGHHVGCLAAEDKEFIDSYLSKTYGVDQYPVKAENVFPELKADFNQMDGVLK